MKISIHVGKEQIEIRNTDRPSPQKDQCLVKVKACGICGSDEWWLEEEKNLEIQGHEITGTIVEVGDKVGSWTEGDRVAIYCVAGCGKCDSCVQGLDAYCQCGPKVITGGFGEYVAVPSRSLLPLDSYFGYEEGSLLTDTLGTPMRALRRIEILDEARVAVWGLGPLGAIAIQGAKAFGAGLVIGIDPIPFRRRLAKKLGADITLDPNQPNIENLIRKETSSLGVDCCVCTVRDNYVAQTGCNLVRRGGWFVSIAGKAQIGGEYEIYASGVWYFGRSEYKTNVELVKNGSIKLKPIITHVFPLDQIQEAFFTRFKKKDSSMKVIVINR
jgi:threonine dehydrogenase-like Zn-dependent dehydrogenase